MPRDRFAEAKCAGCHTTGHEYVQDPGDKHWKATGDGQLGVGCEQCHGPGSKHVEDAKDAAAKGTPLASGTSTIVHPLKDLNAYQQNQICAACHGADLPKPKGHFGYVLDLKRVAGNSEMVIPSEPEQSELFALVKHDEMPPVDSPRGGLSAEQKEIIRTWIAAGAPDMRVELPKAPTSPDTKPASTSQSANIRSTCRSYFFVNRSR